MQKKQDITIDTDQTAAYTVNNAPWIYLRDLYWEHFETKNDDQEDCDKWVASQLCSKNANGKSKRTAKQALIRLLHKNYLTPKELANMDDDQLKMRFGEGYDKSPRPKPHPRRLCQRSLYEILGIIKHYDSPADANRALGFQKGRQSIILFINELRIPELDPIKKGWVYEDLHKALNEDNLWQLIEKNELYKSRHQGKRKAPNPLTSVKKKRKVETLSSSIVSASATSPFEFEYLAKQIIENYTTNTGPCAVLRDLYQVYWDRWGNKPGSHVWVANQFHETHKTLSRLLKKNKLTPEVLANMTDEDLRNRFGKDYNKSPRPVIRCRRLCERSYYEIFTVVKQNNSANNAHEAFGFKNINEGIIPFINRLYIPELNPLKKSWTYEELHNALNTEELWKRIENNPDYRLTPLPLQFRGKKTAESESLQVSIPSESAAKNYDPCETESSLTFQDIAQIPQQVQPLETASPLKSSDGDESIFSQDRGAIYPESQQLTMQLSAQEPVKLNDEDADLQAYLIGFLTKEREEARETDLAQKKTPYTKMRFFPPSTEDDNSFTFHMASDNAFK